MALTGKCPKCGDEGDGCPEYHGYTGDGFCPMYRDCHTFNQDEADQFNVITVKQHELMRKGALYDDLKRRSDRSALIMIVGGFFLMAGALYAIARDMFSWH